MVGCTTDQLKRNSENVLYFVLDVESPYQMEDSATYMANVPCVNYTIYYNRTNPPRNSFGNKYRLGYHYSAASDWSWMPVDTIFEVKGQKFIIDTYSTNLIDTKAIHLYVTQTNNPNLNSAYLDYNTIKILKWGGYEKSVKLLKAYQDNNVFEKIMAGVP